MSTQPERLQLTEASSSYFAQTGRYLWRHRDKIAVGGAVCAAGLVIYYSLSKKSTENEDEKKILAEVKRRRPGDRSRMLLRIRKQFDFAIRQFLPTMHTRILEVVDVSSAIRKIKELRTANGESNRSSEDSSAFMRTEALLWDEIKVSSLTLVYVSAYMVSAVTVLLRIQLHILGKSMESVLQSQSNVEESESNLGADDVFKILIEGTYKHIFGTGLQALSDYVRPRVMECFAEWNVRDNLAVDFDDLAQTMSRVHRNIERDSTSLAKMIMLRTSNTFLFCHLLQ